ncbi:hypothetical protein REPUB_Repub02eG0090900 [Reevesia pubescens]
MVAAGGLVEDIRDMTKMFMNCNINHISSHESEQMKKNPDASLKRLGIGDTTQPIPEIITLAMAENVLGLSTIQGLKDKGLNKAI